MQLAAVADRALGAPPRLCTIVPVHGGGGFRCLQRQQEKNEAAGQQQGSCMCRSLLMGQLALSVLKAKGSILNGGGYCEEQGGKGTLKTRVLLLLRFTILGVSKWAEAPRQSQKATEAKSHVQR